MTEFNKEQEPGILRIRFKIDLSMLKTIIEDIGEHMVSPKDELTVEQCMEIADEFFEKLVTSYDNFSCDSDFTEADHRSFCNVSELYLSLQRDAAQHSEAQNVSSSVISDLDYDIHSSEGSNISHPSTCDVPPSNSRQDQNVESAEFAPELTFVDKAESTSCYPVLSVAGDRPTLTKSRPQSEITKSTSLDFSLSDDQSSPKTDYVSNLDPSVHEYPVSLEHENASVSRQFNPSDGEDRSSELYSMLGSGAHLTTEDCSTSMALCTEHEEIKSESLSSNPDPSERLVHKTHSFESENLDYSSETSNTQPQFSCQCGQQLNIAPVKTSLDEKSRREKLELLAIRIKNRLSGENVSTTCLNHKHRTCASKFPRTLYGATVMMSLNITSLGLWIYDEIT